MSWWKWVGLAGVLTVAASGTVVVVRRRRRTWREYEPDEIRTRLRERLEHGAAAGADATAAVAD